MRVGHSGAVATRARLTAGRAIARLVAAIIVVVVTLAACGSESSSPPTAAPSAPTSPTRSPSTSAVPTPEPASRLPDITVDDIAGGKVRLSDLTPAALPTLVWFWAPH
jgi:hypothetical protein